jgi:putative membrane protein
VTRNLLFAGLVLAGSPALSHGGHEHQAPGWTWDSWIILPLGLALALFLVGRARLAARSRLPRKRALLFLGGWAVLGLSLVSPLHEGGEESFTLHMIEHELIMLVATLMLAAARSGGTLAWGLPNGLRRSLGGNWSRPIRAAWRALTEPVTATIVQALVMWAWHAPALFDRALAQPGWHAAQHLSFVAASLLFWTAMLNPRGGAMLTVACLFLTSLVEAALGALMALSTSPWYSAYAAMGMSGIGLDPVADQQLAGLLMWVPGGLVHVGAALVILYLWLTGEKQSPPPMPARTPTKYR